MHASWSVFFGDRWVAGVFLVYFLFFIFIFLPTSLSIYLGLGFLSHYCSHTILYVTFIVFVLHTYIMAYCFLFVCFSRFLSGFICIVRVFLLFSFLSLHLCRCYILIFFVFPLLVWLCIVLCLRYSLCKNIYIRPISSAGYFY